MGWYMPRQGLHHGHVAGVEVLVLLWHLVQRQVPAVLGLRRLHRQPRPCRRRLRPGPGHGGRLGPAALPRALLLLLGPWALHGPGLHTGHGAAVLARLLGPLWRRPGDLVGAAAGQRAGLAVGFLPRASILVLLPLRGGLGRLRLPFGCDCLGFLLQLLLPLLLLALLLLLIGLANLALGLFRHQFRDASGHLWGLNLLGRGRGRLRRLCHRRWQLLRRRCGLGLLEVDEGRRSRRRRLLGQVLAARLEEPLGFRQRACGVETLGKEILLVLVDRLPGHELATPDELFVSAVGPARPPPAEGATREERQIHRQLSHELCHVVDGEVLRSVGHRLVH
mmetsp:Transcript_104/g.378  ORF Transcript_104/g.378 Transcript_104/m.378 type:complete len:336 (+) Transcript_104:480-1487(+)